MKKTGKDTASSIRSGFGSTMLLLLSIACFIVMLWAVMAIVRFIVELTL